MHPQTQLRAHEVAKRNAPGWTEFKETAKRLSSPGSCFIHAYVWGPWLRKMTFYLPYPAALENVIICLDSEWFLGAIIEGCGDALWSVVHAALIIPRFFTNKQWDVSSSPALVTSGFCLFLCVSFIYCYISLCLPVFAFLQAICWTCWSGEPTPRGSTTASPSWRRSMARRSSK